MNYTEENQKTVKIQCKMIKNILKEPFPIHVGCTVIIHYAESRLWTHDRVIEYDGVNHNNR